MAKQSIYVTLVIPPETANVKIAELASIGVAVAARTKIGVSEQITFSVPDSVGFSGDAKPKSPSKSRAGITFSRLTLPVSN